MNFKYILKKSAKPWHYKLIHQMMYRYLSVPLTWVLLKLRATPNQVTTLNLLAKLASIVTAFMYLKLPTVILFELGILFDCADGAIARITKKFSKKGFLYDAIGDLLVNRIFYVALALGLFFHFRNNFNSIYILIAALTLLAVTSARERVFDYTEKTETNLEKAKEKNSIAAQIFTTLINFNKVAFPFIIFANLQIILAFYALNIATELLRTLFYLHTIFSTVKE
tara:strand:+ start:117 stop:791 length:675 start_codon:yes stop_codon:yes gene_type:complete